MRRHIIRALSAATAGIALFTLGFAGAGSAAAAGAPSLGPLVYTTNDVGYVATGQLFRFVSASVTVPAAIPSGSATTNMIITLGNANPINHVRYGLLVRPGGGSGSVGWTNGQSVTPIPLSPGIGDQLQISVYYNQGNGYIYFTTADVTQGVTRTVQVHVGNPQLNEARLTGNAEGGLVAPPAADTRLWAVSGARLTTDTGTHGTVTGPWQTSKIIQTVTGTAASTVIRSPSGLWNGGANFGVWLRAVPVTYTTGFAGYTDDGGPFRFAGTTMTVPTAQTAANGGTALVGFGHNGGPTPRPYANIEVLPGGGTGSISYDSNAAHGTFTVNPKPGDQLRVSVYYDRNGHYSLAVTDTTQATTQTITMAAPYAASMPLNSAGVAVMFDNSAMTPPPADTQIWQFTTSNVTTYGGDHGSILGPWATSQRIDTTDGTHTGAVVADASVLANAGQDFGVWLRHH
jgi:hypothetical protein